MADKNTLRKNRYGTICGEIPMNKTILSSVVGSHLHGLNTEASDLDVVDIQVEPTISTFGIHHLAKRKTSQYFDEVTNTDISLVEVIHFCYEASKGNHKFLESLWSNQILKSTPEGEWIISIREAFLSKRLEHSFSGIVTSMLDRYEKTGQEKSLINAIYYNDLFQRVWTTGDFLLDVSNSSTFSAKVDRYKENNYLEVNQIHEFAEGSVSCLPEQPNTTVIQNTVDKIRMKNLPLHVYLGMLLAPTKEYTLDEM